ncbi:MAG: hypothetical protein IJV40_07300 [Oscillospiraceae bacterium]|nr:hypothetical protein [Oscillospiraceae bacterium]
MTALLIIAVVALIIHNRKLEKQLSSMTEWQCVTDSRLDKLSRTSRKHTSRQRKYEQKLDQQRKKQARLAKEQERIRKEQTRQAETISKLSFRLSQAEADIQHQQTRLSQLFALLDIAEANQAAAVPGSTQDVRCQKQIITLTNQIAACEKRIAKAQFDRDTAAAAIAA